MSFVKCTSVWTAYVLTVALLVMGALGMLGWPPHRVLHTAIPACASTHKQLVVVPIECGKSDICEAPLIVDVCDQLNLPTNVARD